MRMSLNPEMHMRIRKCCENCSNRFRCGNYKPPLPQRLHARRFKSDPAVPPVNGLDH